MGGVSVVDTEIGCREAEVALLGALLHIGGTFDGRVLVLTMLEPEDFVDPRHRLVLDGIRGCIGRQVPPDPVAVLAELRRTGRERSFLADRSAGVFLADLYAGAPVPQSARHYWRSVVEHRARRRVVEASTRLLQAAGDVPLDDLRELIRTEAQGVNQVFDRLDGAEQPAAVA